jgi:hypothetical protein
MPRRKIKAVRLGVQASSRQQLDEGKGESAPGSSIYSSKQQQQAAASSSSSVATEIHEAEEAK